MQQLAAEQTSYQLPVIPVQDRAVFIGPSDSGKTQLLKALLRAQYNCVVVDTKHVENWRDVGEVIKGRSRIFHVRAGRWIWRTPDEYEYDERLINLFCQHVLKQRNRVIAFDEVGDTAASANSYPRYFKKLITEGRASKVGVWTGTQRPAAVPIWAISEAKHIFAFNMVMPQDRKKIEYVFQRLNLPWELLGEHEFFYRDPQKRVWGPVRLARQYLRL